MDVLKAKYINLYKDPVFEEAFTRAELAAMTGEQRDAYLQSFLHYSEFKSVVDTAVEEALDEQLSQFIRNAIAKGYDDASIADLTGVHPEKIAQLRANPS